MNKHTGTLVLTCHGTRVEGRGKLLRVSSPLLLCGFQGSNLAHQSPWQPSLPTEPSHWPFLTSASIFLCISISVFPYSDSVCVLLCLYFSRFCESRFAITHWIYSKMLEFLLHSITYLYKCVCMHVCARVCRHKYINVPETKEESIGIFRP